MCNIPCFANLYTGYSSCQFPRDIISHQFCVLSSHPSEWWWASIHYPEVKIGAYTKAKQDVSEECLFISARLGSWIKGGVKRPRSYQEKGILLEAHLSAKGHCYNPYTQLYTDSFYINSCIYSILPPSLFTAHVDAQISTKDSDHCFTVRPIWHATIP